MATVPLTTLRTTRYLDEEVIISLYDLVVKWACGMAAEFARVEKSSLADDLAERIAEMIRGGRYEPGDRLPAITEMARRFGVGHPSVREALKQLEVVGIVEIKHGSGVYVRKGRDILLVGNPVFGGIPSKRLLLDLIQARIPIETTSAALAAAHATPGQLDRLTELMQEAGTNLDDDAVLNEMNMAFHAEIATASHNRVLAQIQDVLTNLFQREQRLILDIYGSRGKDHDEHEGILDAIRSHDSDLARDLMQKHLEGVRQTILQWDPENTPLL